MTQTQSPKLDKRKRKGEGHHCNVLCGSVHHVVLSNAQRKALRIQSFGKRGVYALWTPASASVNLWQAVDSRKTP